jgi:hypothetical protein
MLKKVLFYSLFVIFLLCLSIFFGIDKIDKTPYAQLPCYSNTYNNINNLIINNLSTKNSFLAGWAKANITPNKPINFAGYGLRPKFEGISDSLFVRSIVMANQQAKIAIVSMDLLIVHPNLAKAIQEQVKTQIPEIKMVYFTATHTHHGIGGWANGLAGSLGMGGYDGEVFEMLVRQTIESIILASKNAKPAQIGYGQIWAKEFVSNRVEGEKISHDNKTSNVDAWLRIVKIKQDIGNEAVMAIYNAHNNGLRHDYNFVSNDYVGGLLDGLKQKTDFAMFASGMVASHRWNGKGEDYESIRQGGKSLAALVLLKLPSITTQKPEKLSFATLPIEVRESQFRISEEYKISSWLFELLVGKLDAYISVLQIGNITFLGMPCDFSGELFAEITQNNSHNSLNNSKNTQAKNNNLVITSFNGAYIGYISHDRLYHFQHNEIRDMNWVAPESSSYFVEITKKLLEKL